LYYDNFHNIGNKKKYLGIGGFGNKSIKMFPKDPRNDVEYYVSCAIQMSAVEGETL